jgi:fructoselysine-6-P-deglycase FrlB-like protein
MMMKHLLFSAALIASVAMPAYSQTKLTREEAMKQVNEISSRFQEDFTKHDAAGLANLFTADGVFVVGAGTSLKGQDAIKQFYAKYFDGPGKKVSDFTTLRPRWKRSESSVMELGRSVIRPLCPKARR